MPRITPLRIVSLLPLAWLCLITTWFLLPSPGVSHSIRDALVDTTLRLGRSVTAAIALTQDLGTTHHSDHDGLLVDWKLQSDLDSDSAILTIGLDSHVNLTDAALRGAHYFSEAATPGAPKTPYVSDPINAPVRAALSDDFYIMPWFAHTDKLLIAWEYRHGSASVKLRVYVPEPRVVQIWKDMAVFDKLTSPSDIKESDRAIGLLATFSSIPVAHFTGADARASIASIRTSDLVGELPSRTWPIRHIIAGPLYVPTFFVLNMIRFFVIGPVSLTIFSAACLLALFLKWYLSGQPPLKEWIVQLPCMVLCCRTQSRKARRRGIWGASGPMADEESGLLGKVPRTTFTTPSTVFKPTKSRPRVFDRA